MRERERERDLIQNEPLDQGIGRLMVLLLPKKRRIWPRNIVMFSYILTREPPLVFILGQNLTSIGFFHSWKWGFQMMERLDKEYKQMPGVSNLMG